MHCHDYNSVCIELLVCKLHSVSSALYLQYTQNNQHCNNQTYKQNRGKLTPLLFLQKRCHDPEPKLPQTQEPALPNRILQCHFIAYGIHLLKVFAEIHHCLILIENTAIFEVMVKAPVIHIDRSACRDPVIRYRHLAVTETRGRGSFPSLWHQPIQGTGI